MTLWIPTRFELWGDVLGYIDPHIRMLIKSSQNTMIAATAPGDAVFGVSPPALSKVVSKATGFTVSTSSWSFLWGVYSKVVSWSGHVARWEDSSCSPPFWSPGFGSPGIVGASGLTCDSISIGTGSTRPSSSPLIHSFFLSGDGTGVSPELIGVAMGLAAGTSTFTTSIFTGTAGAAGGGSLGFWPEQVHRAVWQFDAGLL